MTKDESAIRNPQSAIIWWLLAILAGFVYFFGLTIPFVGPDEARYAQVAREMLERGDWITPTLGGFNWFEKPPLLYWLEIVSFKAFGINEFAARLGPALFGLGTVVSLWILGKSLATENTENTDRLYSSHSVSSVISVADSFANWLALIAASTLGIIVFSHGASFDIIITFPITAALVSFFIFDQSEDTSFKKKYLPLILFYVFIGIALLAKGLIGIIFPFAIVGFFYFLSRRRPSRIFVISLFWGTLLAITIASIWSLPMYLRHGHEFIDEFFIEHHFERFTSNKYQHPQPFYFYLWVLPLMTLPWLPFFLGSIWNFSFQHKATENTESTEDSQNEYTRSPDHTFSHSHLLTFSAAWLLVPLFFFSFSGSKLPGYILPAVPAAVIFTAVFIFERGEKWRKAPILIAASTFGFVILLLIFAVPRYAESDSVKTLIQAANGRGYDSNRVLTLHTISHNAEFYAAGRLARDSEGKQLRLSGIGEVLTEIPAENHRTVLVLIPLEYLSQMTDSEKLKTEVIKNNGELAIAAVSLK